MNYIDEQRQVALLERTRSVITNANKSITIRQSVCSLDVSVVVGCSLTEENKNQIQNSLTAVDSIGGAIEFDLQGCERLSNMIYVAIAQQLPDSNVSVQIKLDSVTEVTINFNHQLKK